MPAYPLEYLPRLGSESRETRERAALDIIALDVAVFASVQAEISAKGCDSYRRGKLRTKLTALRNNIQSWRAWIDEGCPPSAPK